MTKFSPAPTASRTARVSKQLPRAVEASKTFARGTQGLARATQVFFAKRTVARKQPPITWDISRFRSPDFRYDTTDLQKVRDRLSEVPADRHGMRYIHGPQEVLYYAERDLDAPYDEFVARVDIARVGLMFRDVLGITTEVLRHNEQGRTTLQLERIAALAQPNYTAFFGKKELDVYKLESLEYGPDAQRNWMRTANSPNGSALCDDGYLGFVRRDDGGTRITFLACQHFPIPRLMELAGVNKIPWLKNLLTEVAYRLFFGATFKNIVAAYDGRDYRIGRASSRRGSS
jgi:hypothetical protein